MSDKSRIRRQSLARRARGFGSSLLVLQFALLTGCAAAQRAVPPTEALPATTLAALVDEYFERQLQQFPTMATAIGDARYNDRLEASASRQFWQQVATIEQTYLDRVEALDAERLPPAARVTRDIFVSERKLALEQLAFREYLMPVDQMGSLATTLAVYGSGSGPQPFRSTSDYDNFLRRAQALPGWVDDAIAAMRVGIAAGITVPRAAMAKVVPQLRQLANAEAESSIFWQPIKNMPDEVSTTDRARLTAQYRALIVDDLAPAYQRLADFIANEYLPNARTSVAWSELPNGQAWYRLRIRAATSTSLSADEIHAIGLAEVERIRAAMEAVRQQVGFKGDLAAFFAFLKNDPRFYFTDPQQLLTGYRATKARIDALLPKMFADFPQADYEVRLVEPFRAASAPGAFYQPPSADGKRPGVFYVNAFNLKAQPIFGMETLSLHEAAPGHHFQIAIQQELTDLPRFRRFNNYVAYAEGWALYCESIGKELGVFTDPYQYYGRLSDEMLRAMRLVVDTGLHAKGWSRDQAIRYMLDNSTLAESDVVAEVERYIVWPGQALGYKIGQLRISALRERAERALGERFDIKAFHSQLLRDGAVPLDVLEAKIERWIQRYP
ncbi:MAG TPA: DUF885 domain-containing protein [Steroidobacteraceae bacterium]|nr:DUF885 domain-containing protein [Steroidobacteraceae bacterium]